MKRMILRRRPARNEVVQQRHDALISGSPNLRVAADGGLTASACFRRLSLFVLGEEPPGGFAKYEFHRVSLPERTAWRPRRIGARSLSMTRIVTSATPYRPS
jgi:hypothetical protein